MPRTSPFFEKNVRTISIFWKMSELTTFSKNNTATFLSKSLPLPVYPALSPHCTMGKEGRRHRRLTELKWSIWRWNMTTALRGRTSLEPQQGTKENAEPCLAGLYGPISKVIGRFDDLDPWKTSKSERSQLLVSLAMASQPQTGKEYT